MTQYLSFVWISLIIISNICCQSPVYKSSFEQNFIPIEGGSISMQIDDSTPLNNLLLRLADDWSFNETGKGYWIGYTNDMFSIAARGDTAIHRLVEIVANPINVKQRTGAIYCLHLIGIEREIVGRASEKFVNSKARLALLQLLKYPGLQKEIMPLLIRDPWLSDIPYILEIVTNCNDDCWPLVNGLTRYEIENPPIHQPLTDSFKNITFKIRVKNESILEPDFDFNAQIKEALLSIRKLENKTISIEDTLFKSNLMGDFRSKLSSLLTINSFFGNLYLDGYTHLGSKIQYYLKNNKLYICSINTAKELWTNWWANQTGLQKMVYNQNHQ